MTSEHQRRDSGWLAGSREHALARLRTDREPWDLIVIGGGITGAGVLREASRRGLRALLVEARDFAWGTSSRSSKMVHGGLRYLGAGHFALTRDAVVERERLLAEAPGLVERMQYLMPHYRHKLPGRHAMGALLWAYDRFAGQRTRDFHPPTQAQQWLPGLRLEGLKGCSRFSDAVTDDARLVLRVLTEALSDGALAVNYLRATEIVSDNGRVAGVRLLDEISGERFDAHASVVVSATGAWTDRLREQMGQAAVIRPLRGSHLVVPAWRLPVSCSLTLMHPDDRRPLFIFPWEGTTVIGTTDLDHTDSIDEEARISDAEIDYLLAAVRHVFPSAELSRADIRSSWSGVRPIVRGNAKTPSKESREHVVWDDQGLISVAGGKLTTFRLIALDVLNAAAPYLSQQPQRPEDERIFAATPALPRPPGMRTRVWQRLQGHYGRDLPALLARAEGLAPIDGTRTVRAELAWAAANESVLHLDDLLLRRTRLGLLLDNGGEDFLPEIRQICQPLLGWNDDRWQQEVTRYRAIWQRHYSIPGRAATAST